uniref:Uncharacterized protein n=1 Tax=Candidatus Kentrum sp. FW TaxID=2126338 RepID=A0A450S7T7_9GAMM|nr:MAG: hypothetical protein BECKFW1821B_GA0114236_100355 [Candidatus Kentron sp. FW]
MTEHPLLFLKLPGHNYLLHIDKRTHIRFRIPHQPIQGPSWYSFPDRDSEIHLIAIPIQFIENNNNLSIIRFHPFRERTTRNNPPAIKPTTRVLRAIIIIVTTITRAMRTRATRIHRNTIDDHPHPAITTPGTRLTFSLLIQNSEPTLSKQGKNRISRRLKTKKPVPGIIPRHDIQARLPPNRADSRILRQLPQNFVLAIQSAKSWQSKQITGAETTANIEVNPTRKIRNPKGRWDISS